MVGIGASAGGLEALELFFKETPPDCGLGFVVVQHQDPTHKGMLAELLQRCTAMPVVQITDRMPVQPGRVHVIPPNHDVSILRGVLHLLEPAQPRGLRLPIDFFLRSLADDQGELAFGVILSGMGSDGTLGCRAIKERAGATFAQSPESAKFPSMPSSAVDSGMADGTAPPERLAAKILAYLAHLPLAGAQPTPNPAAKDQGGLEKVVLLLRAQTGHDFSLYKKSTIARRVERRMGLHQLARLDDYVRLLRSNPPEAELLFKELLIGVTSFFRDSGMWDLLRAEVIPTLLAARPEGGTFRAWIPGCSTGEEAYSLAMVFREAVGEMKPGARHSLQIFATDLDKEAIDQARAGSYPLNIAADVSEERLRRFFTQEEHGHRVGKEIREMVIFATQNLVMDPPFTKLDILSCRNLLIYLEPELQKKLLPLFHYSLNPNGVLILGGAETVGQHSDRFQALPGNGRIYKAREPSGRTSQIEFPAAFSRRSHPAAGGQDLPRPAAATPNLQSLADGLLLGHFTPPAVLATSAGDILYIRGKTGRYLEPAVGKANLNLLAMAREGLAQALGDAFHAAVRKNEEVRVKDVTVGSNGGAQRVEVTLQPLSEPSELRGMVLVVFHELPPPPPSKAGGKAPRGADQSALLEGLKRELAQARSELQSTREETQTAQEEFKSANEELQSTNEELQSTNEELTTSKEEMQSMNEELQTVNHELQARVEDLTRASDDMVNLLNSTEIATLFLDDKLRIRRFTPRAATLIKLIPGDAGRPITDLVSELSYPELAEDAGEVLRTLIFRERQVSARDGRWFTARVMPYRTQDNRISGVVITFINISATKAMETSIHKAAAALRAPRSGAKPAEAARLALAALGESPPDTSTPTPPPRGKGSRGGGANP